MDIAQHKPALFCFLAVVARIKFGNISAPALVQAQL